MGIVVWSAASSLQGEPNTREGVRKRAMESLPEKGATASREGSGIKASIDGEANAGNAEENTEKIISPLRALREPRVRFI